MENLLFFCLQGQKRRGKSPKCSHDMRFKMKLQFLILLSLDVSGCIGLQMVHEFDDIYLRLEFPPLYGGYVKSCCKVYSNGCQTLLDSTGYTADFLRGRVSFTETNSWIEFKVAQAQTEDEGYYRCVLLGAPAYIYADHWLYVIGTSADQDKQYRIPLPTITESPELIGTQVAQVTSDHFISRTIWTFATLAAIIMIVVVASVIGGALCFRSKTKSKHLGKCAKGPPESSKEDAIETSDVIYATVDFPRELYVMGAPDAGVVEYSVLAVHR
ncbi:uncharacterized protein LOC133170017 [Syngnathus typhle]|uniref:uncharacterized protein LOC133170017 n=1 Tax=Syngnathus typhle TaxID=161592 RepID=UPI002A6B4D06|nr:uncharacterized protein LOC133170017 [Syngnathus typhle]